MLSEVRIHQELSRNLSLMDFFSIFKIKTTSLTLLHCVGFDLARSRYHICYQSSFFGTFCLKTPSRNTFFDDAKMETGTSLDLFKSPSDKKIPVNDNMSIRVQRSPRLRKETNDDLFPLAKYNELGHMLLPRLRNDIEPGEQSLCLLSRKHVLQFCWTTRSLLSIFHLLCPVYVVLAKLT